jgi:TRAP-type C4-dicarboxylate transport system substrate-binding protein
MMKKSRLFLAMLAGLAAICFLTSGMALAAKKPVTLRLVIATPEGDWPQTFRDKEMAKRFNERANGEYVIEVYTGMALAKLPEFFDAVRIGAVEMEFSNWGMFSFLEPRLGLLETPFLYASNAATSAACGKLLPLYDPILKEKFNAKGLAMMSTGGLGLWSQKPVKTLEDIKGLLVASVSPSTSTMLKELGASPVTIVFTDIYESLQKHVVDAASQSAHGGVVFSFPDVCKYFTEVYCMPAPAGYTINLKVWNKMPANIQNILLEETQKAAEWMNNVMQNELPDLDLKTFKEKGVEVYYMPKEERDRWAAKVKPYTDKELAAFGELGAATKKIADEVNQKYPYAPDKSNF